MGKSQVSNPAWLHVTVESPYSRPSGPQNHSAKITFNGPVLTTLRHYPGPRTIMKRVVEYVHFTFIVLGANKGQQTVDVIEKVSVKSDTADRLSMHVKDTFVTTCLDILAQLYIVAE